MTDSDEGSTGGWNAGASLGSHPSIEQLLGEFLPDLQSYVRRHAGRLALAGESSADLVQSVCRELLVHLGDGRFEFQGIGQFRKWLYRSALLKISARRRYHGAERRDPGRERSGLLDPQTSSTAPAPASPEVSPSQAAVIHEELDRLHETLEALPPRYVEVISLAQIDGLSHLEIAAHLGITENHSRVLLARALARLASSYRRGAPRS